VNRPQEPLRQGQREHDRTAQGGSAAMSAGRSAWLTSSRDGSIETPTRIDPNVTSSSSSGCWISSVRAWLA